MFFTVIYRSGWKGDNWKVARTFTSEEEARNYVSSNQVSEPKEDFYNMSIQGHRKPLSKLITYHDYGANTVKFNGGVTAIDLGEPPKGEVLTK